MIQFFVVVAVALGIASVLIVSVVQKSREIGILRAVGTPRAARPRVFLIQGGVLGLVGSLLRVGARRAASPSSSRAIVARPGWTPQIPGAARPVAAPLAPRARHRRGPLAAVIPARQRRASSIRRRRSAMADRVHRCRRARRQGVRRARLHPRARRRRPRARTGELTALVGPSGSGKSTLLNIIGLLDRPTSGPGRGSTASDTSGLDERASPTLRARMLGFVFQFHHLLPAFTALENVMLPAWARSRPAVAADARQRGGAARRRRPRRPRGLPDQRPLGRAAAARGDCAGARAPAAARARRRADRQPRHRLVGRGLRD